MADESASLTVFMFMLYGTLESCFLAFCCSWLRPSHNDHMVCSVLFAQLLTTPTLELLLQSWFVVQGVNGATSADTSVLQLVGSTAS